MKFNLKVLLFIVLGGVALIFILSKLIEMAPPNIMDSRFAPRQWVNLDETESPPPGGQSRPAPDKPPIRIAIAPVITPEKSLSMYQGIGDYLGDKLGKGAILLHRQTYAEVNNLVRYRRCDMAFVCTYAFVEGERDFGMEVLVVPEIGGKITYHSYIIVPPSSEAKSLLDLRGKSFASADILSNTGWLFPMIWLKNRGEDPEHFFSKHLITHSHDRSVLAVVSKNVDGAAVDNLVYEQMAEEDPTILAKTRIILKSPPFGMPPIIVHPDIDPALKSQIREALLRMHEDPDGRKALLPLRIDRFVVPDSKIYDSVREASLVMEQRR